MAKMTFEQAIEVISLLLGAGATTEDVQRTLIERFDLIEIMMRYPQAVRAMNPAAFEAFILGNVFSPEMLLEAAADEGAVTEYGYPIAWQFRPVEEQLSALAAFLPDLRCEAEIPARLPEGAEGWLVVPKPSSVGATYNAALEELIPLLMREPLRLSNDREGRLGSGYLRVVERSSQALSELERVTPGDYLVLAVQCGLRHRATSVSAARDAFEDREFGLGPFEVACLLLTHPDRLGAYEHLGIDCPGCAYAPEGDFQHSHCLYFIWDENAIRLDCSSIEGSAPGFGSASGFLW